MIFFNFRVNERTNFWRKAAITDQREPKPQSERNPEWRTDYKKNNLGDQQKTSEGKQIFYLSIFIIILRRGRENLVKEFSLCHFNVHLIYILL